MVKRYEDIKVNLINTGSVDVVELIGRYVNNMVVKLALDTIVVEVLVIKIIG